MIYIAFEYDNCGADQQASIIGVYSSEKLAIASVVAHIKKEAPDFEVMKIPGVETITDQVFIDEYRDIYHNGERIIEIVEKEINK